MVEFVFNAGRDGWTDDMIQKFQRLSWRYCILMEEHFGTQACMINLHNLIHFHEDISRFSPLTTTGAHSLRELFHVTFDNLVTEGIWRKHLQEMSLKENSLSFAHLEISSTERHSTSPKVNREKVRVVF